MEPLITVACATYNHAEYIRDALDGFLMQECSYPYEIIVHDDASTDGTADIIREYTEKYPGRIRAILQTENQHSKGVSLLQNLYSKARGQYVAICEGDDYWTDPLKLQKQLDALMAHPECDICATCAALSSNGNIIGKCAPADRDTVLTPEQVILGGGNYVATCSLVIKAETQRQRPEFRQILSVDYSLQILGSLRGGMVYLADQTCVYRTFVKGSWTSNYFANREKRIAFDDKMMRMLRKLDEETYGKYTDAISYKLKELQYFRYNNECEFEKMLSPELREVYKKQPLVNRIRLRIKCLFPGLIRNYRQKRFTK